MNEKVLFINVSIFCLIIFSWLVPRRFGFTFFTITSSAVLTWFSIETSLALLGFTTMTYVLCKATLRWTELFFPSIFLLVLVFVVAQLLHFESATIIVIGIIYTTCRQVHFFIESFKQQKPICSFGDYLRYQFYLPCMIAGPIQRVSPFLTQSRRRKFDIEQVSNGIERLVIGHTKIILIATILLQIIQIRLLGDSLSLFGQSILDWVELYFLFSGFSDIAIGFSLMLGIKIPENFNFPFLSRNISEFWQRWHISLSTWCKDYVFTPISATTRSIVLASFASMIVIGLWHEFSLRYVLWGIYHGSGIYLLQILSQKKWIRPLPKPLGIAITLVFVVSSYPIIFVASEVLISLMP